MILGFGNNTTSKLASDITSLQTNIPIDPGIGEKFAKLLTTDLSNTDVDHKIIAKITLSNLQQNVWEICHLTAVDGDNLTVIRGQEGTASRGWRLGDLVGNFATRGSENNFVQLEQLQGGDYVYSAALGTGNNLVVNLPSTYTADNWDLKTPIVISPNANNTGNVTVQLILGGMNIGTFPVYRANKVPLVRNDIIAGIPFIIILDKTKTFFSIIDSNGLPLTGGKVSGEVSVNGLQSRAYISSENDQNSDLRLLRATGDRSGYFIRRYGDDLYIYKAENGVATDKLAQYIKATDTWDFPTEGLTKNDKPLLTDIDFSSSLGEKGWYQLPGGLLIQWLKGSGNGKKLWAKPFKSWVVCTVSGTVNSGSEVRDWNVNYDLTGVSGNLQTYMSAIAIGDAMDE